MLVIRHALQMLMPVSSVVQMLLDGFRLSAVMAGLLDPASNTDIFRTMFEDATDSFIEITQPRIPVTTHSPVIFSSEM